MSKSIEIKCINNNQTKKYNLGTSLTDIIKDQDIKLAYPILGAMVNNKLEELSYQIYKPKTIEFIDITHRDGRRMYMRSLSFILIKAVKELYPEKKVKIEHSISKGYYCEIEGIDTDKLLEITSDVENRMRQIIDKNIPFKREEVLVKEALKIL